MTACITLVILPIKYIYELQHRVPTNFDLMNRINNDKRILTENSNNRNDRLENERDKLLIQPIVCLDYFSNYF